MAVLRGSCFELLVAATGGASFVGLGGAAAFADWGGCEAADGGGAAFAGCGGCEAADGGGAAFAGWGGCEAADGGGAAFAGWGGCEAADGAGGLELPPATGGGAAPTFNTSMGSMMGLPSQRPAMPWSKTQPPPTFKKPGLPGLSETTACEASNSSPAMMVSPVGSDATSGSLRRRIFVKARYLPGRRAANAVADLLDLNGKALCGIWKPWGWEP